MKGFIIIAWLTAVATFAQSGYEFSVIRENRLLQLKIRPARVPAGVFRG